MTATATDARALYLGLLASAEGLQGKTEVASAIARAALSRMTRGRGALHVRRSVIIAAAGLRWWVPPLDNSFASTVPGRDNNSVMPELRRLLATRPQSVCLDIGANLGFVCMPLAREFPGRHFVAIEPVPWLADALERTAQLNHLSNVTVAACAIADADTIELSIPTVGGVNLTTLSSGASFASPEAAGKTVAVHRVPAVTLDALLDRLDIRSEDIACIKLDVEGLEAEVLSTGRRALSVRPPVLFEALTPELLESTESVLRGFGYATFRELDAQNFSAS